MRSIISLCSGIGGLDLAVERFFNAKVIAHSEINKHASKVMEHRFPNSTALGDLTTCDASNLVTDILCAGFPCKPVSNANQHQGQRIGQDHEEWVFDDIIKFMQSMPALPKGVVFENVQGLQNHNSGRTFRHVLREITKLGYHTAWAVVWARDAGAPHRRARLFLLSHLTDSDLNGEEEIRQELQLATRQGQVLRQWGDYGPAIARWERIIGRPHPDPILKDQSGIDPRFHEWLMGFDEGWVTDIIETRSNQIELIGNAVCPQQGQLALRVLQDRFQ